MNTKDPNPAPEAFSHLPEDMREFIIHVAGNAALRKGLFPGVVVGDCPTCGSFNTLAGNDTPLGDSTLGLCLDCYRLVCLECGEILEKGQTSCDHWKVCETCALAGQTGCGTPVWACSIIESWKMELRRRRECSVEMPDTD